MTLTPAQFETQTLTAAPSVRTDVNHMKELIKLTTAMCQANAQSIPDHFRVRGKLNHFDVAMAIAFGETMGLDILTSLQNVYFINGRAGITANLQRTLATKAGYKLDFQRLRDGKPAEEVPRNSVKSKIVDELVTENRRLSIRAVISGPDGRSSTIVVSYNELWELGNINLGSKAPGKSPWVRYPFNMLIASGTRDLVKWCAPESLSGVAYTTGELLETGQIAYLEEPEPEEPDEEIEVSDAVVVDDEGQPVIEPEELKPAEECKMDEATLQETLKREIVEPVEVPPAAEEPESDYAADLKSLRFTQSDFVAKALELELIDKKKPFKEVVAQDDGRQIFEMVTTGLMEDRAEQ